MSDRLTEEQRTLIALVEENRRDDIPMVGEVWEKAIRLADDASGEVTDGPWVVEAYGDTAIFVVREDPRQIVAKLDFGQATRNPDSLTPSRATCLKNARYIAAAKAACEQFSTQELEGASVSDLVLAVTGLRQWIVNGMKAPPEGQLTACENALKKFEPS